MVIHYLFTACKISGQHGGPKWLKNQIVEFPGVRKTHTENEENQEGKL